MKPKDTTALSLPSQLELATLAAALPSGTAADRVTLAFEIWEASSKPWKLETEFYRRRMEHREALAKEWCATAIPINSALEHLFPELPPALRLDRWQELLRWRNGGATPSVLPETVDITAALFDELREFEAASKGQVFANRAKVAALGRYGTKWAEEALAGEKSQTLEMLISNTARKLKEDRPNAKVRVEALIEEGLIVNDGGKLYGIKSDP